MIALGLILTLAVIVEALIENFGEPLSAQMKVWVSAVLGVVVCIAYSADLLAILGYTAGIPYIGAVLTGLLIGRGSNYINDIVTRVRTPQLTSIVADSLRTTNVAVQTDTNTVNTNPQAPLTELPKHDILS
jgi:hypothetical protein